MNEIKFLSVIYLGTFFGKYRMGQVLSLRDFLSICPCVGAVSRSAKGQYIG